MFSQASMLSRNNVRCRQKARGFELALSYHAPISEVSVWQQKRHEILCSRLTEYSMLPRYCTFRLIYGFRSFPNLY